LLVHRPKYDDWTLPKGKLDPGETHEQAAVREVLEETGLRCTRGGELASTTYRDRHGRPKRVRYWEMAVEGGRFTPNREVDEVRWVDVGAAERLLSYARDREVVRALAP
jgi:8-oxo-dGTP diphosphatase